MIELFCLRAKHIYASKLSAPTKQFGAPPNTLWSVVRDRKLAVSLLDNDKDNLIIKDVNYGSLDEGTVNRKNRIVWTMPGTCFAQILHWFIFIVALTQNKSLAPQPDFPTTITHEKNYFACKQKSSIAYVCSKTSTDKEHVSESASRHIWLRNLSTLLQNVSFSSSLSKTSSSSTSMGTSSSPSYAMGL